LVAATVLDSLHVEWLQKGEAPCRLAPYRPEFSVRSS
jgi:hypothetical protein